MKIAMIGASGFVGTRLLGLLGEEPQKYDCKNISRWTVNWPVPT